MKKSLILMLGLGITLIVAGCTVDIPNEPASRTDLPNEPASRTSHPIAPSLGAQATAIPVQNPSFEDFSTFGLFTANGVGLNGFGWTVTAGTNVGVFKAGGHFFVPIPDGINTAYSSNATISQVLNEVLAPNTIYTLEVGIGNQNNVPFGGYRVQLLAGGTLLAEDNNTLSPANGTFQTSIVTFNAPPNDPNLGQPLEIRLVPLGGSSLNTNYDNVRLTKTTAVLEFAAFHIQRARVELDRRVGRDRFEVRGSFALGTGSDGIMPLTEDVTVTFDGFEQTIPAGSFVRHGDHFQFDGTPGGITRLEIRDDGEFRVKGRGQAPRGISLDNPVPFSLQIGDDGGQTTIEFDKSVLRFDREEDDDEEEDDEDEG